MKHCRDCIQWYYTSQWKGNCARHPWYKDKYSEDATADGCEDYIDKRLAESAKEALKEA
jgi:hypothetical protein